MFTLPHNTIARFYKQPVDMRLGMFRLQGQRHLHAGQWLRKMRPMGVLPILT